MKHLVKMSDLGEPHSFNNIICSSFDSELKILSVRLDIYPDRSQVYFELKVGGNPKGRWCDNQLQEALDTYNSY